MRVLITCGGGFQGLSLFKELRHIGNIFSIVCDFNEENVTRYFCDDFVKAPPVAQKNKYISFLREYCSENKVDYIIPATLVDIEILASLKQEFKNKFDCNILICDSNYLRIFLDKKKTHDYLQQNGISVQPCLNPYLDKSYPIIGKPLGGFGSQGILIFKNIMQFIAAGIGNADRFLWTRLIDDFEEYSVDFSINSSGISIRPIIRKRIATSGGFAVITQTLDEYPAPLLNIVSQVVNLFSCPALIGIYNVQVLLENNSCFVSDINPRMGTSAVLGTATGSNLVNHLFVSTNVEETGCRRSVKAVRYLDESFYPKLNTQGVQGVVFDLDDTLISNKQFIIDRAVLLYKNFPDLFGDFSSFLINVVALLNEGKAPSLIDDLCRIFHIEKIREGILSVYQKCFPSSVYVYPDVSPALKKLKRCGLKLYILTDNPVKTQKVKISLMKESVYFDDIYFTHDENIEKPDTFCFKKISVETEIPLHNLIMVGDNQYRDLLGAVNSGYRYCFHIIRPDGIISHFNFENISKDYKDRVVKLKNLKDLGIYLM